MKLILTSLVAGILFLAIALIVIFYQDTFIKSRIIKSVELQPESELYKNWLNPPSEVYINFYFYSLNNSEEFEREGAKPILHEVGPFAYRQYRVKDNVTDNKNGTITYSQKIIYKFAPERSVHDETYEITTINLAVVTLVNHLYNTEGQHRAANMGIGMSLSGLTITKTVGELLWGYEDSLLFVLNSQGKAESTSLGLFKGKNNTYEGSYTIFTGVGDISKLGKIERFNGRANVSAWHSEYANMINGTDGSIGSPFIDKNAKRYSFQSSFCRSFYSVYTGSDKIGKAGKDVELWRFGSDAYYHKDNASAYPERVHFCLDLENCLGVGVTDLSGCIKSGAVSAPIILSNPHFLYADNRYVNGCEGVSPGEYDKHATQLFLEPQTGIMMRAKKRVQFNVNVKQDTRLNVAKSVKSVIFPVVWLDELFEADEKTVEKFYDKVKFPVFIINIVKYVLLGIGCLLILVSIILYIIRYNRKYILLKTSGGKNGKRVTKGETPL